MRIASGLIAGSCSQRAWLGLYFAKGAYKIPVDEIDLVALQGNQLALVEMKQRKSFEDAG